MGQPSIYKQPQRQTWDSYKNDIVAVLLEGLLMLREKNNLTVGEVNLNRELFFCFKRAAYKLGLNYLLPIPEGNNPPYEGDEERAKRENKRPDFYWQFCDDTVDDPKWSDRRFILECKCLGMPRSSSSSWILNRNYIQHGIIRFLTEEHEYAKGDELGAMVGYVESMELEAILCEVNSHIAACGIPIPLLNTPADGWQKKRISRLEHTLIRNFPRSPFLLLHFWIDIRDCCFLPPPIGAEDSSAEQRALKARKESKSRTAKQNRSERKPAKQSYQIALPIEQGGKNT